MRVQIIPALDDNYIYLIVSDEEVAIIDPASAAPIMAVIEALPALPKTILITHGHPDHIAGCEALVRTFGCNILAPNANGLPPLARKLADGDQIRVGNVTFKVIATPGHSSDHVTYYSEKECMLFSGDTLFAGGCGRSMAAPPKVLWNALLKLRALPGDTQLYCGHNYTLDNLVFAATLEPDNAALTARIEQTRATVAAGKPTVPSTLDLELATNPFLRADTPALRRAVKLPDAPAVEVFAEIRRRKDRWG